MSLSPTNRGSPQLAVPLELESFYECPIELDGLVTFHADVAAFRAGFQVSALNVSGRAASGRLPVAQTDANYSPP